MCERSVKRLKHYFEKRGCLQVALFYVQIFKFGSMVDHNIVFVIKKEIKEQPSTSLFFLLFSERTTVVENPY